MNDGGLRGFCGIIDEGLVISFKRKEYLGGFLKEGIIEFNFKYIRLYLKLDRLVRFFILFYCDIFIF